jgi:hypothetical protein
MGSIPIISDIIEGVKWLITFFTEKVPKPITVLIFLLFVFVISLLMGIMLHVVGIHCNTDNEPMKTDTMAFYQNINVYYASQDTLNAQTYTFEQLFENKDKSDIVFYGKLNTTNGFYEDCGENYSTGCSYYLLHGACYNCTYGDVCVSKTLWFCGEYVQICKTDAYAWAGGAGEALSAAGCSSHLYARIPAHYLWNITSGRYECFEPAFCGPNPTKAANSQLDDLLESMSATLYYENTSDRDVTRMVGITCSNAQPQLAFFKIPLFDYRIWVIIILIYVMFMFLVNTGQQSHL